MANNDTWLCQAVGDSSRARHPLAGIKFLQDVCKLALEKSVPAQQEFDPMGDLEAGSALADQSTPPKRTPPKRARSREEAPCVPTDVRVVDVMRDIGVFPPSQRPKMEQACLRVLIVSSGKGGLKMLYVKEEHLDLCLTIIMTLSSRFGVPHADLPDDSALADETQWFDIRTHRWHQRRSDTGEIAVSDAVPRLGLTTAAFQKAKADALEALTSRP